MYLLLIVSIGLKSSCQLCIIVLCKGICAHAICCGAVEDHYKQMTSEDHLLCNFSQMVANFLLSGVDIHKYKHWSEAYMYVHVFQRGLMLVKVAVLA